jgi:20S proteasome subunit alpha 7
MLGAEKTVVSDLSIPGTDRRIYSINKQIGMVLTGLIPDGRALVQKARSESTSYYEFHGVPIPGKVLAERVASVIHNNTMRSWSRPYGVVVIFASFDKFNGPALHMIDAAGQCYGYFGCAAGKERQMARNEIEKLSLKDLTCRDAAFQLARMYNLNSL